ncbi:MAG: hypothetical protein L0H84_06425 [Pseudonocardia sp.]|nr:hypothetical protein [Pseudonocardia sp.]
MRRMSGACTSAPAIAFGLLTWLVAHALTYLLFAHIHVDAVPRIHWHGGPDPILVAVAGLLVTAAFAGRAVSPARHAMRSTATARRFEPVTANAVCAPAAFVTVEFVQHVSSGDEGPPTMLLLIGLALHTAMGAATPVLWTEFVRDALGAVLAPCAAAAAGDDREPVRCEDRTLAGSRHTTPLGSRGPPVAA